MHRVGMIGVLRKNLAVKSFRLAKIAGVVQFNRLLQQVFHSFNLDEVYEPELDFASAISPDRSFVAEVSAEDEASPTASGSSSMVTDFITSSAAVCRPIEALPLVGEAAAALAR